MKTIFKLTFILFLLSMISCKKDAIQTNNPSSPIDSVIADADGNIYDTVVIGTQVWTLENLNTINYRNGDQLNEITNINLATLDTSGSFYNSHTSLLTTVLYSWKAINDPRNISVYLADKNRIVSNGSSGSYKALGDEGWHIPADSDWAKLSGSNWAHNVDTLHLNLAVGAIEMFEYNRMAQGGFNSTSGCWWSTTSSSNYTDFIEYMNNNTHGVFGLNMYQDSACAFAVRCVRNLN